MSPKQEGTPPRRGLTLPQAVRAVGWGLLQPAERMRPPRGDPCKDAGAAVKGKTASGCGNAASSALVPRVQLCPGPPGSPQHPSVAKLISKTPGAAPGCGRGHRACARSLVSSRPFPGALGGLLDLGGHFGGALVSLHHAEASPSAQALGTAVPLVTIPGEEVKPRWAPRCEESRVPAP